MMDIVYFIKAVEAPIVKIGITGDPRKRLHTLQTASPFELEIAFQGRGTIHTERRLHRRFATCRRRGEWFILDTDIIWTIFALTVCGHSIDEFLDATESKTHAPTPESLGFTPETVETPAAMMAAWSHVKSLFGEQP